MEWNGETRACPAQVNSGATQRALRMGAGCGEVCHMHKAVAAHNITKRGGIREFYRASEKFGICGRQAVMSRRVETLAVIDPQYTEPGFAQPHRLFKHCIEHGRQIAG